MDCCFSLLTPVALTDFVQKKYRGNWPLRSSMFIHVPHLYIAVLCQFEVMALPTSFHSHLRFSTDGEKVSQHVGNM